MYNAAKGDGNGDYGRTGAGYPVGNGLILTAWHVIRPEQRDDTFAISVQWQSEPGRPWRPLDPHDPIAWEGDNDLDAALIRSEYPPGALSIGVLSHAHPLSGQDWESAGFPDSAKSAGSRPPIPFSGKTEAWVGGPDFHFTVPAGEPDTAGGWRGVSGMPIFRKGTTVIVGVAKSVPKGFKGNRLTAVATAALLSNPAFARVLGDRDQADRRAQYRDWLIEELTGSAVAAAELAKVLKRQAKLAADEVATADTVAKHMLELPIDQAVQALYATFQALRGAGSRRPGKTAAADIAGLQRIARLVAAALHDRAVAAVVASETAAGGRALPTSLGMVAEIIIAASASPPREPEFHPREGENDFPYGTRFVQRHPEPEAGIGGMSGSAQAVRKALLRKWLPEDDAATLWRATRPDIDTHLVNTFLDEENKTLSQAENLLRVSNALMLDGVYLLCPLPTVPEHRAVVEAELARLKESVPGLLIFLLATDESLKTTELKVFDPFRRVLP
jgi:hypothetical protein